MVVFVLHTHCDCKGTTNFLHMQIFNHFFTKIARALAHIKKKLYLCTRNV